MKLKPLLHFTVEVDAVIDLGRCGGVGQRRSPMTGGSVSGDHNGSIQAGGGDWQSVGPFGNLEVVARYVPSLAYLNTSLPSVPASA